MSDNCCRGSEHSSGELGRVVAVQFGSAGDIRSSFLVLLRISSFAWSGWASTGSSIRCSGYFGIMLRGGGKAITGTVHQLWPRSPDDDCRMVLFSFRMSVVGVLRGRVWLSQLIGCLHVARTANGRPWMLDTQRAADDSPCSCDHLLFALPAARNSGAAKWFSHDLHRTRYLVEICRSGQVL